MAAPGRGCKWHNECLTCSFPVCLQEIGDRKLRIMLMVGEAERLWYSGLTQAEVAKIMGISLKTAWRWLNHKV